MQDYASRQRHPRRHGAGLALVVLLHLLFFWALQSGLVQVTQKAQVVVDAVLLTEDKPSIPTPPAPKNLPPPPKNAPPPPAYVPPVDVPVTAPPAPNAVAAVTSTPAPAAPAALAAPVAYKTESVRTSAVGVFCQKPEYPRNAIRMEEEGEVALSYVVGVDGQVLRVDIVKSSGYKRLDNAAVEQVQKWKFKPATVDGKPIEQTMTKRLKFSLTNDAQPAKDEGAAC